MISKKNLFFVIFIIIFFSLIFSFLHKKTTTNILKNYQLQNKYIVKKISNSIEDYFLNSKNSLKFLTKQQEIYKNNKNMKSLLKNYYNSYSSIIKGITKVDKNGRIVYTYPYDKNVIGRNISHQEHNKRVKKNKKPTLSTIIVTVQGYRAIIYAFPLMKDGEYYGSLNCLISYQKIAEKYLKKLKTSKNSYSFLIDKKGKILYHPKLHFYSKSSYEIAKNSENLGEIIDRMRKGQSGEGTYIYKETGFEGTKEVKKYISYYPIYIEDTIWSFGIVSNYNSLIKSSIINKIFYLVIMAVVAILGILYIYYTTKTKIQKKDIQIRKSIQKKLRKTRNYLRKIIDSSPSLLLSVDKNGKIEDYNNTIFKYVMNRKIKDKHFWNILSFLSKYKEDFENVIEKKKYINHNNVRIIIGEETKYINIYMYPIFDNDYNVDGIIIRVDDITEIVKKNLQIENIQKMNLVGNLAGGLAHDFNNVLGGIEGTVFLLEKRLKDKIEIEGKIEKYINVLKKSTKRAEGVINQLINISKTKNIDKDVVSLNYIVNEIIEICKSSLDKRIEITSEIGVDNAYICGDEGKLIQVLMNICINSEHAMIDMRKSNKKGGELKIKLDIVEERKYYQVTISDNGVGMKSRTIKNIFNPFFTKKDTGTGLGLYITKNIIKQHDGIIRVNSKINKGTSFRIIFPVVNDIEKLNKKNSLKKENLLIPHKKRKNIMIIDDEKMIREISTELLNHLGHNTVAFKDGYKAIKYYKKNNENIDLILLDLSMPIISGYEVFNKLKEIKKDIKVILITGHKNDTRIVNMLNNGLNAVLKKPFNLQKLSKILKDVLN